MNRIQKLLFSEYSELEELVLLESPFAETERNGNAVRQVQIGLTPRNLIIAGDVITPADEVEIHFCFELDPEIESLELISIIPVECVNLSVFSRRKRHTLKAHFCNAVIKYYELGGSEHRRMFWNLWCEKVRFLSPSEDFSCLSETSAGSSSTESSLYIKSKKHTVSESGNHRVWCVFGRDEAKDKNVSNHEEKSVLSDNHVAELLPVNRSVLRGTSLTEIRVNFEEPFQKKRRAKSYSSALSKCPTQQRITSFTSSKNFQINRFGNGIPENCQLGLFLNVEQCEQGDEGDNEQQCCCMKSMQGKLYPEDLSESAQKLDEEVLQLWESRRARKKRHFRRYGFCAYPSFVNGFTTKHLAKNEFYSIQVKHAVSALSLSAISDEKEFQLPISKCSLKLSVSLDGISPGPRFLDTCHSRSRIFFWTPGFWYCPVTFHKMYQMLREHLQKMDSFLHKRGKKVRRSVLNSRKKRRHVNGKFGTNYYVCDDTTLQYFKRKLKKNVKLSVWNFNSTILAYQLTMIDRDLFCKVEGIEIEILLNQHSARNTPNIAAIIAFSHRVSCLVATDILEQQNVKSRSLLIVRFINVAQRCDTLQNFQSCHSVLEGLQSPPIHRLQKTWDCVRKEYPSKYCLFEKLCRKHRDPRLPAYQKAFYQASLKPPFLPFIGDILARALERVPNFPLKLLSQCSREYFKNFNASHVQEVTEAGTGTTDVRETARSPSRTTRYIHCIRQFLSFFHIISISSINSIIDNKSSEVSQGELPNYSKNETDSIQTSDVQTRCTLPNNGNSEVQFKNFNPGNMSSSLHPNYGVLKVGGVVHLLDWYKRGAMVYDFTPDKLARDYLLKSHYKEEIENHLLSVKLETTAKNNQQ